MYRLWRRRFFGSCRIYWIDFRLSSWIWDPVGISIHSIHGMGMRVGMWNGEHVRLPECCGHDIQNLEIGRAKPAYTMAHRVLASPQKDNSQHTCPFALPSLPLLLALSSLPLPLASPSLFLPLAYPLCLCCLLCLFCFFYLL